jgi:hypothetical protein
MNEQGDRAQPQWLSARAAARELGVHRSQIPKIARAGEIHVRFIPGLFARYSADDIARLKQNSTQTGSEVA